MANVADFVQVFSQFYTNGRRFESLRPSFGIFILNKVCHAIEIYIHSAYSYNLFLLEVHTVMSLNSLHPESGRSNFNFWGSRPDYEKSKRVES